MYDPTKPVSASNPDRPGDASYGYWTRHNERIRNTRTILRIGKLRLTYVPRRYRMTDADRAYRAALLAAAERAAGRS